MKRVYAVDATKLTESCVSLTIFVTTRMNYAFAQVLIRESLVDVLTPQKNLYVSEEIFQRVLHWP